MKYFLCCRCHSYRLSNNQIFSFYPFYLSISAAPIKVLKQWRHLTLHYIRHLTNEKHSSWGLILNCGIKSKTKKANTYIVDKNVFRLTEFGHIRTLNAHAVTQFTFQPLRQKLFFSIELSLEILTVQIRSKKCRA